MSCQQLIQEDPYIFTDTLSNSTSFMHENNSQTKYVPLNRQTIYNRQFRQHEPTIALSIDTNGRKSSPKIIISPSSLKQQQQQQQDHHKKNGFFKISDEIDDDFDDDDEDNKIKIKEEIFSISNHSIASQSVSKKELNNVKDENGGGINGITTTKTSTTTGIKQEISEDENDEKEKKVLEITGKSTRDRKTRKVKKNRCNRVRTTSATSSKNVTVEPISEISSRNFACIELDVIGRHNYINMGENLSGRDERLKMKKFYLRHLLSRHETLHQDRKRSMDQSRREFVRANKLLKEMNCEREENSKRSVKKCYLRDCGDEAIALSDYCIKHILSGEKEQYLIRQCCFLHADGQQCRVPVYDIMATIAVCNDHLNASPNQLITINGSSNNICSSNANSINNYDSMKPKKPQIQRKRNNNNNTNKNCHQLIRPVKKCGRKKKIPASPIKFSPLSMTTSNINNMTIPAHRPTMIIHPNDIQKKTSLKTTTSLPPLKMDSQNNSVVHESSHPSFIHHNSGNLLASSQSSYGSMSNSGNEDLYLKQDLMTAVCENSYESSEDTGVGGLSENELMSNDVIGNFDMESCAELSKVLSSLPSNTLDDLLTEPLHTSRDDEEYLDRAIEEVSASGMDQIAITAFEHLEGLDMLEMLDDEEQRQMISAATNLISMSGYLSHDADNNYAAMPSPMMS